MFTAFTKPDLICDELSDETGTPAQLDVGRRTTHHPDEPDTKPHIWVPGDNPRTKTCDKRRLAGTGSRVTRDERVLFGRHTTHTRPIGKEQNIHLASATGIAGIFRCRGRHWLSTRTRVRSASRRWALASLKRWSRQRRGSVGAEGKLGQDWGKTATRVSRATGLPARLSVCPPFLDSAWTFSITHPPSLLIVLGNRRHSLPDSERDYCCDKAHGSDITHANSTFPARQDWTGGRVWFGGFVRLALRRSGQGFPGFLGWVGVDSLRYGMVGGRHRRVQAWFGVWTGRAKRGVISPRAGQSPIPVSYPVTQPVWCGIAGLASAAKPVGPVLPPRGGGNGLVSHRGWLFREEAALRSCLRLHVGGRVGSCCVVGREGRNLA